MSMFKKAGDQIQLRETGAPVQLFIVEQFGFSNFPDGQMMQFIDAVANNGGNGVRVFGFYPFGKGREEEPYVRVGGGFDMNRFNDAYFHYLRQWMDHAQKRGVVVLFELFDSVGLKYSQVTEFHPFGQFTEGRLSAFSNLRDQNLVRYQKEYLTQMVNTLKQYPNVIFGIMNEFSGDAEWHYEMSRHVKTLAPNHLISGSEEDSPAMGDPNVDTWAIHTGSYNFSNCSSNVGADIAKWRPHFGGKIITFSTDGFGRRGMACENPDAMRRLAQDVKNNGLQIFRFLDHLAYLGLDDAGNEYPLGEWSKQAHVYDSARVSKLNTATYRAIAEVFPATRLPATEPVSPGSQPSPEPDQQPTPAPTGAVLGVYDVASLPSNHPDVFSDRGGKAIVATTTKGFLSFGPYVKGFPPKTLDVYYSIYIDNNTADNRRILTLDVYDSFSKKVLQRMPVTRKQFKQAGAFNLFKLRIRVLAEANLEFRIFYEGYSYIAADRIAVVDPKQVTLKDHSDIVNLRAGTVQPQPAPQPEPEPMPAAGGNIIISESLKDGKSVATIGGGNFTSEGVQLSGGEGYVSYLIPMTSRGYIEFKAKGFQYNELHGGSEYKGVLLTMWDDRVGYSYDNASFIFELRKYGYIEGRRDATDTLWFKIKSNGEWTENPRTVLSWDPETTYKFRIEWGNGETRVIRDGQTTATGKYRAEFAPSGHKIQIGANPLRGRKTAHNLLIADVVIGRL